MDPAFVSLVIRQISAGLMSFRFWAIIAGAVVICFLSGPFGTLEHLPDGLRFIYWGLICVSSGLVGLSAHTFVSAKGWKRPLILCLCGIVFGLVISAIVVSISLALLGPAERYPGTLELLSYCLPTAAILFTISLYIDARIREGNLSETSQERPVLFKRLKKYPHAQQIHALVAQDHYVEVTTELGTELCLIRLGDAIREAAPIEGIQIHRSNWIAKSAVKALNLGNKESSVSLQNGAKLKVSQARRAELTDFLKA